MAVFSALHTDQITIKGKNVAADISRHNDEIASLQAEMQKQNEKIQEMQRLLNWSADTIEKLSGV